MQIPSNHNIFQAISITKSSDSNLNWKPGQIVQANVVSNVVDGLVNLRIGATLLTAQVKANLEIGQKLTLEVIKLGDKPVLQLIAENKIQNQIEAAIRTVLPKQQNHAQLLSNLVEGLSKNQLTRFPEQIQSVIKRLYQSLPDLNALRSANGVKNAINNSGLFLEAKLAQQTVSTAFNQDFKANLLRLYRALQQQIPLSNSPVNTTQTSESNPPILRPALQASIQSSVQNLLNTSSQAAIQKAAQAASAILDKTTVPTTSPLESRSLLSSATKPDYLFIRQNFTQVTTGSLIRTFTPEQALASQVSTGINNQQSPAQPINRFFLPANFSPSSPSAVIQSAVSAQSASAGNIPVYPSIIRTMPMNLILQQLTPELIAAKNTPTSLMYASHIPFKADFNFEISKPSARFSRLDNLSKILSFFLKDAESSLARIQLNQLTHHNVEPDQKPSWVFEIPVRHNNDIDLFQFKIQHENNNEDESDNENNGWTIQVSFNITSLGQVYSNITIHQKSTSITFWSEQKQTVKLFQKHLQELQNDLEDAGLIVKQLCCIEGSPPASFTHELINNILDERA